MPSRREFIAGAAAVTGAAYASVPASGASAPTRTWSRTYAPADYERAFVHDVAPVGDGFGLVGLAGGMDRYRGWASRVDAAGRSRWHDLRGTGRSVLFAGVPSVDDENAIVAAGVTNGSGDFAPTNTADPYVVRAGPDGEATWARTYQPDVSEGQSNAIARVGDGYVVAGNGVVEGSERPWAAALDRYGTQRWSWFGDQTGSVNAASAASGGAIVGGSTWPPGSDAPEPRASQEGAWIARLAADGNRDWRWSVDREGGDRIESLAPGPDGGAVAVGRRSFATDDEGVGWLVALDAAGNRRWERTYPREAWNWLNDVAPAGDGYVLVGTREEGPETDARGAWLLRVDAEGRVVWEFQAETGTRGNAARSLADGGLLVAGERSGGDGSGNAAWAAKFGGESATASGTRDGPSHPSVPGWTAPFLAGGTLGALCTGAWAHWRQSQQ